MNDRPGSPSPIKYGWDDIRDMNSTERTIATALERIMEQLDYIITRQDGEDD